MSLKMLMGLALELALRIILGPCRSWRQAIKWQNLFTSNLILNTTKTCDLPVGSSLDSEVGAMEPPTTWNGICPRTLGQHGQPSGEAESGKLPNLHFCTYFSDSCGVPSQVWATKSKDKSEPWVLMIRGWCGELIIHSQFHKHWLSCLGPLH